jgi:hypothetical protein
LLSQTIPADFAGFEASDAERQAVIGPVPPGADSSGRSASIDYMQPIPGSEQSNLGAFLADPDQVIRTHNYGQSAPDDAPLLVGGSGVDFGPRIGVIDYFKIIGGGIASFIPESVRDFEYSRIVAESTRLSSVDNVEYDGIDDYSVGNGKGWTLSLPSYDDVKAGFGKAYDALAATFGEGQNTRDVSGLEYKDIDSYPEDLGSGWRLSVPTGGELVDFANAMYGRSLSASNAYRDAIEQGNHYRAGLAFGSDPMVQGLGLMVGTFGLTKPLSASGRPVANGRVGITEEFAGGTNTFIDDLSPFTGKRVQSGNRAIQAIINEDFFDLNLMYKPKYSPYASTGVTGYAPYYNNPGVQIGSKSLESRFALRDTVIHEELHNRWRYKQDITVNHHYDGKADYTSDLKYRDMKFYSTIERYKRMRGWEYNLDYTKEWSDYVRANSAQRQSIVESHW